MKKLLSLALVLCMMATMLSVPAMAESMKAGVYTATAKGMYDGLTVEVTVSETAIEKIEVTAHQETSPGWPAIDKIPAAIIENQTVAVDAVAGATSYNHIEDEIMCKMIAQAKQKYLVVDDFKIGKEAFAHIADLTAFDGVITNYVPRLEEHYQAIRDLGVKIIFDEE